MEGVKSAQFVSALLGLEQRVGRPERQEQSWYLRHRRRRQTQQPRTRCRGSKLHRRSPLLPPFLPPLPRRLLTRNRPIRSFAQCFRAEDHGSVSQRLGGIGHQHDKHRRQRPGSAGRAAARKPRRRRRSPPVRPPPGRPPRHRRTALARPEGTERARKREVRRTSDRWEEGQSGDPRKTLNETLRSIEELTMGKDGLPGPLTRGRGRDGGV